jgi:hypothetical protein
MIIDASASVLSVLATPLVLVLLIRLRTSWNLAMPNWVPHKVGGGLQLGCYEQDHEPIRRPVAGHAVPRLIAVAK